MNPLLRFDTLPLFDQIHPEHVPEAIDALLEQAEGALAAVIADSFPAQWTECWMWPPRDSAWPGAR
jgi:oligopeptidase A